MRILTLPVDDATAEDYNSADPEEWDEETVKNLFGEPPIFMPGCLAFSEPVCRNMSDTLSNPKFDKYLLLEKRLLFLEKLVAEGDLTPVTKNISICRDPKDDKYLQLAVACNASYIITGDKDLLILHPFQNISILSPVDFINHD